MLDIRKRHCLESRRVNWPDYGVDLCRHHSHILEIHRVGPVSNFDTIPAIFVKIGLLRFLKILHS